MGLGASGRRVHVGQLKWGTCTVSSPASTISHPLCHGTLPLSRMICKKIFLQKQVPCVLILSAMAVM